MNNEILQKILTKKEITINDHIKFRTIFDIISTLFTDENKLSLLQGHYMINEQQQVWFPNITPNQEKEAEITKEYANYMSDDWSTIYQFTSNTDITKRKNRAEKYLKDKREFITFAKINEKTKGIGYHFIGIFTFTGFVDKNFTTMIFKKISDSYKFN